MKINILHVLKEYKFLRGEIFMSTPNKDEVEGKFDQAKGWVKDKVGEATGNDRLEREGEAENAEGHAQESWGKVKHGVGDAVDAVGDAVSNVGKDVNKA